MFEYMHACIGEKKKKFGIVSNATFVAKNLEKSRQERKDKTRLSRDPVVVASSFAANRFPPLGGTVFRKSYRLN